MRYKKLLALFVVSLMAGVFASPAHAEDLNVQFYGVVDAGVGYATHSLNIDPNISAGISPLVNKYAKKDVVGMFNGGISDSRIGLKGSEDLDGGRKFLFTLETGFNLPTGTLNNNALAVASNPAGSQVSDNINSSLSGQLFNRQAWLGISDPAAGTLTLGRTYNFIFDVLSVYDPVKNAQLFSPLGFSGGFGGGAGVSEDTRVDDSVKWTKKFGDVNAGLAYGFGGVAGGNAGSSQQVNLGYDNGAFGVQVLWERHDDAIKVSNPASATPTVTLPTTLPATATALPTTAQVAAAAYNTTDYLIALKYQFGEKGEIKGGYQHYTLSNPSNPTADKAITNLFGLTAAVTPNNTTDQNIGIYFIGGSCNVTSKFNLSVGYYSVNYDGYTNVSTNAAIGTGSQTFYSFLADYSLSKATDAYLGIIATNVSGWNNGVNTDTTFNGQSDTTYGIGLRHKF